MNYNDTNDETTSNGGGRILVALLTTPLIGLLSFFVLLAASFSYDVVRCEPNGWQSFFGVGANLLYAYVLVIGSVLYAVMIVQSIMWLKTRKLSLAKIVLKEYLTILVAAIIALAFIVWSVPPAKSSGYRCEKAFLPVLLARHSALYGLKPIV